MSTSSRPNWAPVGQWAATSSNSERDKRKKIFAALMEVTLTRPHLLDAEDATIVALSAPHIIDIIEQEQRLAAASLFAIALRRSFGGEMCATHIGDVLSVVVPLGFTSPSKLRYHRRALAADYVASAAAIYPEVFVKVAVDRVTAMFSPLWAELTTNRMWAKRGFGTGKSEQEDMFEETSSYRCSVMSVLQLAADFGGHPEMRDRAIECLNETGYKARDFSASRVALAVAAEACAANSAAELSNVHHVVLTRAVHLEPPEKGAQKTLYSNGAATDILWTWDTRSVRYYAACLCSVLNADPSSEAAQQKLTDIAASSTEDILLDVALTVATNLDCRAIWPTLAGRLIERTIAAMLSKNAAMTIAAIDVLRKLVVSFLRLVSVASTDPAMLAATKSNFGPPASLWFRDLYGALRHIFSIFLSDNAMLSRGMVVWLEATLLQRCLDAVDDDTVSDTLGEIVQVTNGRECGATCLCDFLATLEFTCSAATNALVMPVLTTFRRPLLEFFAEALYNRDITSATGPSTQQIVRNFFAVVDTPFAHLHADVQHCFTLKGLKAVAMRLDSSDPLLPRIAADCGIIATLWQKLVGQTESTVAAQGDLRLQLFEAVAIASTVTRRVALSTTFATL